MEELPDIRRRRLRLLIDNEFDGNQTAFALRIEREANYISRVLNKTKGIGENFCRMVEARCGKPAGWLDRAEGEADVDRQITYAVREPTPAAPAATAQLGIDDLPEKILAQIRALLMPFAICYDDVILDEDEVIRRMRKRQDRTATEEESLPGFIWLQDSPTPAADRRKKKR